MRIPNKQPLNKRHQFVVEQTKRGVSFTETAHLMGVSRERVRQIARLYGLTAKDWRDKHKALCLANKQAAVEQNHVFRTRETRTRQRARRLFLIQAVQAVVKTQGSPPTLQQLTEKTGMWPTDISRYFVGSMTGNWAQRGFRRLYRLAGTAPRKPGRPGWIKA